MQGAIAMMTVNAQATRWRNAETGGPVVVERERERRAMVVLAASMEATPRGPVGRGLNACASRGFRQFCFDREPLSPLGSVS